MVAGVGGFDGDGFACHRLDFDRFDALRNAGRSHDLLQFRQRDGFGFFAGIGFVRAGVRIFAKFESEETSFTFFVVIAQDTAHGFLRGTFADRCGFLGRDEFGDTSFDGSLFLHNDFLVRDGEDGISFAGLRGALGKGDTANGVSVRATGIEAFAGSRSGQ